MGDRPRSHFDLTRSPHFGPSETKNRLGHAFTTDRGGFTALVIVDAALEC